MLKTILRIDCGFQMHRDNISLRQQDVKNINLSLNRCLEEGEQVLTFNDFATLSQSRTVIGKVEQLETENVEYHRQAQLIGTIPFNISSQRLFEMVDVLGTVGIPREFDCSCNTSI